MLYIIYLLFTDGFPSGQRGQTVTLLAPPSKVRILLHPANLALTSLRCRSYFFCAKRKPQRGRTAAAPLHTPRAFFKEFLVVDEGRVLTCVCMLGYWMWDAVPIWFLYASVLIVGHCADLVSVCFGVGCGVLCRFIFLGIRPAALLVMDCFEAVFCMLRYWMRNTVPIWFLYASVLDVERCADLFLYIVFFWHWAGYTFASILCSLWLNFQPGMWQRYGLLRRRCDIA